MVPWEGVGLGWGGVGVKHFKLSFFLLLVTQLFFFFFFGREFVFGNRDFGVFF